AWGVTPHAASGGPPQANLAKLNTAVQFFSETAKVVFPSYAADPGFVQKFTTTMMTFMAYINELEYWKHQDPDYVALAHSNLNVDNAYFWRDEAGNLDCGVLDWGGFGSGCLGHKIWWYLNCSEWQPIQEHLGHYVDTFIQSYHTSGGPALDRDRLLLM
ncbi:CPK2, partial [Symbiodinium sp. KB8]